MIKIVVDAGHGGYDNSASYNGRLEKEDNLNLALRVGELLSTKGYDVIFTRTSDIYQSPFEKTQIANANNADYFVSIHRNSSPISNTYSGVETLVYDKSGIKAHLAANVNDELEKIGFANLGVNERPGLVVLRRTQMPSILIEVGFLNNDGDNQLFDERFDEIANAIATGMNEVIQKVAVPTYAVQIGLYEFYSNAKHLQDITRAQGFHSEIVYHDPYYKVWVVDGKTLDSAVELQNILRSYGYDTLVVKK